MAGHDEGTRVEWDWGEGTATGVVEKLYTQKVTLAIKGTDVTRVASDEEPAYLIEQDDGDQVLKGHSEVRRVS